MVQPTKRAISSYQEAVDVIDEMAAAGLSQQQVSYIYSRWGTTYDSVYALAKYRTPEMAAEEMAAVVGDKKNSRILDCAAGTGLVGEKLVALGFSNIDALDASREMLEIARSRGIYGNLICDIMGPNTLNIADNTYDGLVAVGCFMDGYVAPDCLKELFRITKMGGRIVITVRAEHLSTHSTLKGDQLETTIKEHAKNGLCKLCGSKVLPKVQYGKDFIVYHIQVC